MKTKIIALVLLLSNLCSLISCYSDDLTISVVDSGSTTIGSYSESSESTLSGSDFATTSNSKHKSPNKASDDTVQRHEHSSNTISSYQEVDQIDTQRKELESKYDVIILYGEETFWNFSNDNIQKLRDKNYIKIGLNNFEGELSRYPSGFFSELSRKLRIFMITSFESDYSGMASYNTPGYFDLYLTATSYSVDTLHHEIMHMIDFTMNEKSEYSGFNSWGTNNPSGFSYTGADYSDDQYVFDGVKSLASCYFVSNYSKKSEYEDRAELFKWLMKNQNINDFFSNPNPIQFKINYLCSEIRRVFKTVQSVNIAAWEQNIK